MIQLSESDTDKSFQYEKIFGNLSGKQKRFEAIPRKEEVQKWIDELIDVLFPVRCSFVYDAGTLRQLHFTFLNLVACITVLNDECRDKINLFFEKLPDIYDDLLIDAKAFWAFDPAAHSIEEVIVAYPGFYAVTVYRLSHELYLMGIPILPRIISEWAHGQTGIDINPGAKIGIGFFIDHGTGIVIGETCVIGDNVKMYQGVTLGALSVIKTEANKKRHPTIEDNVVIYSGATILGGRTVIGKDSVIGGNVWLTESVPPNSLVYHKSEVRVRKNIDFDEPLNFVI